VNFHDALPNRIGGNVPDEERLCRAIKQGGGRRSSGIPLWVGFQPDIDLSEFTMPLSG